MPIFVIDGDKYEFQNEDEAVAHADSVGANEIHPADAVPLDMTAVKQRAKLHGYSGLTDAEKAVLDSAFPKSQAAKRMDIETMRNILDAQASGANGPREVASAVAESQGNAGEVPGSLQGAFPAASANQQIAALDPSTQTYSIDDFRRKITPQWYEDLNNWIHPSERVSDQQRGAILGDMASAFGRSIRGIGSGVFHGLLAAAGNAEENSQAGADASSGIVPKFGHAFGQAFQESIASPTGFWGAPSSALLAVPPLRASELLGAAGIEGLAARASMAEGAYPFLMGAAMSLPTGLAFGTAGEGLNSLGGGERLPVAMPDASAALALNPRTVSSLVAGGGPGDMATQPTRSLGSAMAHPVTGMALNAIGSGLAESALRWVPGVNAIIDREIKYARNGGLGAGPRAGQEMAARLAEVIDQANGQSGLGGLVRGVGAIGNTSERAAREAQLGYGAVGEAIAPNTIRVTGDRRPLVMDPAHPQFGKPLPNQEMGGEWLGWVAPPGKEAELSSSLAGLRALVPSGEARSFPGVVEDYALPEGSFIDVGRGTPVAMNDLYQEARQNIFQKMHQGHKSYSGFGHEKVDRDLAAKFQGAHGTQYNHPLYRGQIPEGESVPPVFWSDLSALRQTANKRSGSKMIEGAREYQDQLRHDFGDVVTRYMYGNNAAIDRTGMRELQRESGRLYKFSKLAEQLAIEDATKRVGQESQIITLLRGAEPLRYRVPMAARALGLSLQRTAAPIASGREEGR